MIALFKYITIYGATLLFGLDVEILMIMRMVIGESRRKIQVLIISERKLVQ